MFVSIVAQSRLEQATGILAQFVGLAVLAATLAGVAAIVYRWYTRELIPAALGLLVGLSGVAIYLNTAAVLDEIVAGSVELTEAEIALLNILGFLLGIGGAVAGRIAGDRFGTNVLLDTPTRAIEEDVSQIVKTVGRVITVELPDELDDAVGYDPIAPSTRKQLAGTKFVFPRKLTVEELHDRLVSRLKTDYAVGHVDLELAADGSIEHLALGSRAAGIGPTLPPETNAVALRADPAFAASSGDLVQVWETEPMERVLTGELRGVSEDTVTLAINSADTPKIDPTRTYRLVTLPVEDRPGREFASLLRAAQQTASAVTVEAGSPLHGMPVGALSPLIVAVTPDEESPRVLPDPDRVLEPGDLVSAITTSDAFRRLETATEPVDPDLVSGVPEPSQELSVSRSVSKPETAGVGGTDAATPEPGERATPRPDSSETPTGADAPAVSRAPDSDAQPSDDGVTSAKADESVFQELKEEFDSGEAGWDGPRNEPSDSEPDEQDSDGEPPVDPDETSVKGERGDSSGERKDTERTASGKGTDPGGAADSASSFQELKEEFESGEADWSDDTDGDSAGEDSETESDDGTAQADSLAVEADDDLDGLEFDDEADDLFESDVLFEDEQGENKRSDDEKADQNADADSDEAGGGAESDDPDSDSEADDDSGGGGGTSFQELKEEFESGEADWDEEISDSPGGDMRLDE